MKARMERAQAGIGRAAPKVRLMNIILSTALVAILAACPSPGAVRAPTTSPTSTATALPLPLVRLTPIATLEVPVAMAVRTGDDALYVAEKTGVVRAIRGGTPDLTPVLDISNEVSGDTEQGLLGLVFSSDGTRLYVDYTDVNGDTRIVEFPMQGEYAVETGRRELLSVDQPYTNHNGGQLLMRDGLLYIFMGDGGSGGDPQNNAQNLGRLLGKVLRIDPTPSGGLPYTIPASNPFVGTTGARGEIWAYGLRNPWRAAFDRATNDLWIADVGQDRWEELNRQPASSPGGENYGWRAYEGTRRYTSGPAPANHTPPVYEYSNSGTNCAVVGGPVYRGARIPALTGFTLFTDFCGGRIMGLRQVTGTYVAEDLLAATPTPSSFGEDHAGELYVLSLSGVVSRIDPLIEV